MESAGEFSTIRKRTVLFDHDGNPDDLVSLMLVLNMPNINLIGVCVTPGDCFIQDAIELTLKTLSLYGKSIPVAEGTIESPYQFPDEYKVATVKANHLPIMILQEMDKSLLVKEPAHEFMIKKLKETNEKVTILLTGPSTNLVAAMEKAPEIKDKIEEVVWMAGAVDVPGNVFKFDHDKTAEWNVYWDSESAKKLFKSGLNVTIFPLDVTNTVPIDLEFIKLLAKGREHNMTDIVGQYYAITFMQSQSGHDECYMWDTLCTSYLGCDKMAQFRRVELDVLTKRPSIGRTIKAPGSGNWVNVACKVDKEKFFKFYFDTLKVHGTLKQVGK